MFVLLFAYVFGGAIPLPNGENYKEFLMPGIFAQTLAFASATTTVGITDDMQKGLVDRYRSSPWLDPRSSPGGRWPMWSTTSAS